MIPELLEFVVLSLSLVEYMDNDEFIVHQDPPTLQLAFDRPWLPSELGESFVDCIDYCSDLGYGIASGNHKEVR